MQSECRILQSFIASEKIDVNLFPKYLQQYRNTLVIHSTFVFKQIKKCLCTNYERARKLFILFLQQDAFYVFDNLRLLFTPWTAHQTLQEELWNEHLQLDRFRFKTLHLVLRTIQSYDLFMRIWNACDNAYTMLKHCEIEQAVEEGLNHIRYQPVDHTIEVIFHLNMLVFSPAFIERLLVQYVSMDVVLTKDPQHINMLLSICPSLVLQKVGTDSFLGSHIKYVQTNLLVYLYMGFPLLFWCYTLSQKQQFNMYDRFKSVKLTFQESYRQLFFTILHQHMSLYRRMQFYTNVMVQKFESEYTGAIKGQYCIIRGVWQLRTKIHKWVEEEREWLWKDFYERICPVVPAFVLQYEIQPCWNEHFDTFYFSEDKLDKKRQNISSLDELEHKKHNETQAREILQTQNDHLIRYVCACLPISEHDRHEVYETLLSQPYMDSLCNIYSLYDT